jgi:hypothetical protein
VTAWPEQRRAGALAAVAARAEAWLFEPAPGRSERVEREAPPACVVAVIGLGRGCGTTTIARAVGVELSRRHPGGVAVVSAGAVPSAALAVGPARRLARRLGEGCRPLGRLALMPDDAALHELAVSRRIPVVFDVSHGEPPELALALADRALLVASPDVEPALAQVAGDALAGGGLPPLVVLNRAVDAEHWGDLADVSVAETRLGARIAASGRDAVGGLASAVAALADACEGVVAGG